MTNETGVTCRCGGTVRVKDWHKQANREFRFESYCASCLKCDPNGWPTLAKAIEEAAGYFAKASQ